MLKRFLKWGKLSKYLNSHKLQTQVSTQGTKTRLQADTRDSIWKSLFKTHSLWSKLQFKLLIFEKLVSIKSQHLPSRHLRTSYAILYFLNTTEWCNGMLAYSTVLKPRTNVEYVWWSQQGCYGSSQSSRIMCLYFCLHFRPSLV